MLNNCTLKENRTWLLVRTWHCYFIPFNDEHPVSTMKSNFSLQVWFAVVEGSDKMGNFEVRKSDLSKD